MASVRGSTDRSVFRSLAPSQGICTCHNNPTGTYIFDTRTPPVDEKRVELLFLRLAPRWSNDLAVHRPIKNLIFFIGINTGPCFPRCAIITRVGLGAENENVSLFSRDTLYEINCNGLSTTTMTTIITMVTIFHS